MHDEEHNSYAWSKASENRTPVFLAIRRTEDLLFSATRCHLGLKSAPLPRHA